MHIRKDHLVIILKEVLGNIQLGKRPHTMEEIADNLLRAARGYAITSRSITISNDKLMRQATKLKASMVSDTSLFSMCLTQIRRKFNHRGINQVLPGEVEWLQLKEICALATEFCNEFRVDRREGYVIYCELAMTKMKNYSLNKFKSLHRVICEEYEALNIIRSDPHDKLTTRAHDIYCKLIAERIGFVQGYKDMPIKYQYFAKAAAESVRMKIEVGVYIKAQFFYIDFTNQVPDPVQLVGPKAIDKLQKYCFENSIKINKVETKVDWKKIKKS